MMLPIDLLSCARKSPASIHSLHAGHDTSLVSGDGQITPRQLLQGPDSVLAVIDGPQQVRAQQFSQLPGIDSVTFATLFQIAIATWITHHKLRDMRLQQVIQPRSPSAFFKRQIQAPAQSMHELKSRIRLGFDDPFHHQLAGRIQNRDRDRVLVNIHPDILCAFHRRVLLSDSETTNAYSLIHGATSYIASVSAVWSRLLPPLRIITFQILKIDNPPPRLPHN